MTAPLTPAEAATHLTAALALKNLVLADDEEQARQYRREAVAAGASALDVARAWRERDERIDAQVVRIYTDAAKQRHPAGKRLRCRCSHGPSTHTGGHGRCWQHPCGCDRYVDHTPPRVPEHLRTDDINDYLRQKGEIS